MSKHLSGPWTILPTATGALSINKTPQVPLATVGGAGWHLGREMAEANARLIAAAPDLLLALRDAIENTDLACWREAARAAIAKATGDA